MVTRRLQAEARTGSVRRPETDVLPTVLTNQPAYSRSIRKMQIVFKVTFDILLHVFYCVIAALSKAQRTLSKTLIEFRFECIGSEQTDDEIIIGVCVF